MLAARHTRLIRAAESLARETFTNVLPSGDGWVDGVVALRQEYLTLVRLVADRHAALRADINNWRKRVNRGAVDFDPADEDEFKESLQALIRLEDILVSQFDAHAGRGLYLAKTLPVRLLRSRREAAQSMLDHWESPEWETAGERVVEWDAEQADYLRSRLGWPR